MKVGNLVRSINEDDGDVGVVIDVITRYAADTPSVRVNVFWGPNPSFGSQFEWDWEHDLEVVEESKLVDGA